jgi:pectate lyase
VSDVIVRNLRCPTPTTTSRPGTRPKDNASGEWNSDYDNLSLRGAAGCGSTAAPSTTAMPPAAPPRSAGPPLQHHDGLLDITRESDLVTVSWSRFLPPRQDQLVGSSDRHTSDEGRLRVTFHHNHWDGVKERAPRVRWGQVHVLRNLYRVPPDSPYGYSAGPGRALARAGEDNVWLTPGRGPPQRLVRLLGATHFVDRGSLHNGRR